MVTCRCTISCIKWQFTSDSSSCRIDAGHIDSIFTWKKNGGV